MRLSELRRASPADTTVQNLLTALGSKLDFCVRLPVYEYEAASEGHVASASAFRALADTERESFTDLLACLQRHLNENSQTGVGRSAAAGGHP